MPMRAWLSLAFFLLACSPKDQIVDASMAPSGSICAPIVGGCSCVPNTTQAAPKGACSPQSLGGAAHCCTSKDDAGAVVSCSCTKDGQCFQTSMTECRCTTTPLDGGTPMPSCTKPMMGHCCASNPDASQSDCHCGSGMCAMGEKEVPGCASGDTALMCASAVPSCQ